MEIKVTDKEPGRRARPGPLLAFTRRPIILIPYLLSILLALLAPDDVLDKVSALKAWAMYVHQYVPIAANYTARSAFPQVTALYFSIVIVAMAPSMFWAALTTPGFLVDDEKVNRLRDKFGVFYLLVAWVGVVLTLLLAYFGVAINPGYDFNVMPVNRSRIALALFGPLFAGGLTAITGAAALKMSQTLLNK